MVLMYAPKDRTTQELRIQGFQDGRRYNDILREMREVRDVADGNRKYVCKLLVTTEDEVLDLVKRYCSHTAFQEYFNEEKRIRGMLKEGETEESKLKKMELAYLASSNNE